MWWSKSERRSYKLDLESKAVVEEYRASIACDTKPVVVPRRKFLCGQPAPKNTQNMATTVKNLW